MSDAWTGFTRFILLNERPRDGYTWSGVRLTRKQTTSRPDDVWPDMWKFVSDAAKKKAKQRWAIEKPKLDNARQLRRIFFIKPNDAEFKLTIHNSSEPTASRGRSVSKKRSIRGKSNLGSIQRQPCRYYLKGTCTRTSCEYWHPPECRFYKTEAGCKAGGKCLFPHHRVDEQSNKKPKKS